MALECPSTDFPLTVFMYRAISEARRGFWRSCETDGDFFQPRSLSIYVLGVPFVGFLGCIIRYGRYRWAYNWSQEDGSIASFITLPETHKNVAHENLTSWKIKISILRFWHIFRALAFRECIV